jgi:Flp pilus assembly protein TadB
VAPVSTLLMAGLGAGVGLGVLLVVLGLRGVRVLPSLDALFPEGTGTGVAAAWVVGGLLIGLLVLSVTGWVGAAIGSLALVVGLPWFFGGDAASRRELERIQAIATWTEMIRDNMAGAAGLEQALQSTADIAPSPIAREVRAFANRLESQAVPDALVRLGDDLDHPAADLVVVSLANAARMESRDLGPLLTRLSDSIRADVRMRLRVDVGRARIRTSSKIVLAVTLFTMGMIYVSSRDLLEVYDTVEGQLWLLVVFGLFIGSLAMMNRYARIELPERFTARRTGSRIDLGVRR